MAVNIQVGYRALHLLPRTYLSLIGRLTPFRRFCFVSYNFLLDRNLGPALAFAGNYAKGRMDMGEKAELLAAIQRVATGMATVEDARLFAEALGVELEEDGE